jgi:peptide-methionine (S)-S-oxide reductase
MKLRTSARGVYPPLGGVFLTVSVRLSSEIRWLAQSPGISARASCASLCFPARNTSRRKLVPMFGLRQKTAMVDAASALAGRDVEMPVAAANVVLGTPMKPPFPEGYEQLVVGMGCFWGAEKVFWEAPGVYTTAVGYAGGLTPNPTYEEVCSGRTGHTEAVLVVFDPSKTSYEEILRLFWENHDPTQGMRQGNDVGTQYRSAIYWSSEDRRAAAEASRAMYAEQLCASGYGDITTEIAQAGPFYYAEDYHQQYLHKNPWGYDCHSGTGISCPIGLNVAMSTADQRSLGNSQ